MTYGLLGFGCVFVWLGSFSFVVVLLFAFCSFKVQTLAKGSVEPKMINNDQK